MLNKLCLGTVQLGLKYGINNQIGRQPTNKEAFSILKAAIDYGIEYFDTSSSYGDAENLLGSFNIGPYHVNIVSKLNLQAGNCSNVPAGVLEQVRFSLERLKISCLNGYLLHNAKDFYQTGVVDGLEICKNKGLVQNIGVSVYEPTDALAAVKSGRIDYIQIPYNVFDQRLDETDFFELADKNKVKVFARSAFLQGLLLMKVEELPVHLLMAKPYLMKFHQIIKTHGYSPAEAAWLFSIFHKGIDKVVFGVESTLQLDSNIKMVERRMGFKACYDDLLGAFSAVEKVIVNPSLWKG